ncbi:hypothetical protein [Ruegeria atlantica]|uniref:hypothetical protein n=1 Tax=Ruegeria atlantica TaxID=81569 RepID=UPI00147998C2|nr:hypothetical protein [Ruegeria atlantica]
MRHLLSSVTILVVTAGLANAGSENSNASAARNMADTLSSTPGIGGAAPTVSGKNAAKGDSGWGNAGSREVSGQQVSRGKKGNR